MFANENPKKKKIVSLNKPLNEWNSLQKESLTKDEEKDEKKNI